MGFCSIGPKSYSIQLSDGKSIVKCKGMQLKGKNECSYTDFRRMVTSNFTMSFEVPFNLRRNMATGELRKVSMTKWLSKEFDKRVIIDNYETIPYGFKLNDRDRRAIGERSITQMELPDDNDDDLFASY